MPSRSMNDILSHIGVVSRELMMRSASSVHNPSSESPLHELPIPECIFPQPQPLRLDVDLGLDCAAAAKLSDAYLRAANRLKARYQQQFRRAYSGFILPRSSSLSSGVVRLQSSLQSAYVHWYAERLATWAEQVKMYGIGILQARRTPIIGTSNADKRTRRSFSQRTISILEKFFEHNAFPSRLEKHDLAAEANMTYTQVHVWNRRRRLRKEGKELKRRDSVSALPSELETSVAELLDSSEADACMPEAVIESLNPLADIFNLEAPPHAFPSVYPPDCPYDPFPIGTDRCMFVTPWLRTPCSTTTTHRPGIDIVELSTSFEGLSLVDPTQIHVDISTISHTPLQPRRALHHRLSDVIGFVAITPHAPHPALIPSAASVPSTVHTKYAASSKSAGPTALSTQISASDTQPKKPRARKVVPLPKRTPTARSIAHGGVSSITSEASTSMRQSSTTSTTSSKLFASDTSLHYAQPTLGAALQSASLQQPSSRRKLAALPNRALARPIPLYNIPPSPPRFISMSSRASSASSSTSSGSSPPSESDTPLSTPPRLPVHLPPHKTLALCIQGDTPDFSSLFNESSIDEYLPADGLQLQLEPAVRIVASYSAH